MEEFHVKDKDFVNPSQILIRIDNIELSLKLLHAICTQDPQEVLKWIKAGADINYRGSSYSTPLLLAVQTFSYEKKEECIKSIKHLLKSDQINPLLKDQQGTTAKLLAISKNLPIVNLLHQAEDGFLANNVISTNLTLTEWQNYLLQTVESNYPLTAETLLSKYNYLHECDLNKIFLAVIKHYRMKIFRVLEKYWSNLTFNHLITRNRAIIATLPANLVINAVLLSDADVNCLLEKILMLLQLTRLKYNQKIKVQVNSPYKNPIYKPSNICVKEYILETSPLFIIASYAGVNGIIELWKVIKKFLDAPTDLNSLITEAWAAEALLIDKNIKMTPLNYCTLDPYCNYYQNIRLKNLLTYYPVNQQNAMGETALLFAIKHSNLTAALELLYDNNHQAISCKNIVKSFILANSFLPEEINNIIFGFIGLAKSVDFGENARILDVNIPDRNNIVPLLAAVNAPERKNKRKNPSVKFKLIEKLLAAGSKINIPKYNVLDLANKIDKIDPKILRLLHEFKKKHELLNYNADANMGNAIVLSHGLSSKLLCIEQEVAQKLHQTELQPLTFSDFHKKVFMRSYDKWVEPTKILNSSLPVMALGENLGIKYSAPTITGPF